MKKGLTIAILTGATLFGVAGAANAQDYRYRDSRMNNPDYTITQMRRDRAPMQARDGTANYGNETTPAGGEGRVNSHSQE